MTSMRSPELHAADWLIDPSSFRAAISMNTTAHEITLENERSGA